MLRPSSSHEKRAITIMNHRTRRLLGSMAALALVLLAGCSEDPEVAKLRYFESGNQYLENEEYDAAIIEYRNAIELDRRYGEARKQLGRALIAVGNLRGAYQERIRAADLLPGDSEAQTDAAVMLLQAGEFEDAETRARRALDADPQNIDAQIVLGSALVRLDDLDGAIAQIEEAIEIDPGQARSYATLGTLEALRGDGGEAESRFRKAIEVEPENVSAHLALAQYLWYANRLEEAEISIAQSVELDPENILANRAAAALFLTTGRMAQAEAPLVRLANAASNSVGLRLQLAQYYLNANRMPDARSELETLAELPQGWGMANAMLATLDYAEGQESTAHDLIDEVIAREPQNVGAHLAQSRFFSAEEDYDQALESARTAVAADPQAANAHYVLGAIHTERDEYVEAITAYNEVLRLNPAATAAQLELSRLYLVSGDAEASERLSEDVLNVAPDNPLARLTLARSLIVNGDLERAGALLSDLEAEFPNVAGVHSQYGSYHTVNEDVAPATRSFERALELDRNNVEALAGLMFLDLAAGRTDDTLLRINQRLSEDPRNAGLLVLSARGHVGRQDFAAAENALRSALAVDPDTLDAYGMLGQLYVVQGRLDDALIEFEELAERQQQSIAAPTMAGMILEMQGRVDEATQRYERALSRNPRAAVAANNLAWHYGESGEDLPRALELAQVAKNVLPDRHEVNDTLGWIFYKMDVPERAIPPLEQSVEQAPDNPEYQFHLGMAYVGANDLAAGERTLTQALALSADFNGADEARRTLSTLTAAR